MTQVLTQHRVTGLRALAASLCGPRPPGPAELAKRAAAIGQAFDTAIAGVSGGAALRGVSLAGAIGGEVNGGGAVSRDEAATAVLLNQMQSSPLAWAAIEWLRRNGLRDVMFRPLDGHHAILDIRTGLLHDAECYAGARSPGELPIQRRRDAQVRAKGVYLSMAVSASDVSAWLMQREAVYMIAAGLEGPHAEEVGQVSL